MSLSIHQEDYNAIKLLNRAGYIISTKELNIVADTEIDVRNIYRKIK